MPTFQPPTVDDSGPIAGDTRGLERRAMRHYKARARGLSVIKRLDGSYYTTTAPDQLTETPPAVAICYLGGYVYAVTTAEAAALTAAGFGAYVT